MIKKIISAVCVLALSSTPCFSTVKLASTTSVQNSGFYDYILPLIEAEINDSIQVIAVGTGQALKLGQNGDADLLIVHAPDKERKFMANGFGVLRIPFMYNQFAFIGPRNDPAKLSSVQSSAEAMTNLSRQGQSGKISFVSRGDNSGTHFKELSLWKAATITPKGKWYIESGSGMGTTLNIAAARNAYVLSDSATWMKFANKQGLIKLFSTDKTLFNQYSVILLSPKLHPHIQHQKAQQIVDWIISKKGQQAINAYTINQQQAFIANAQHSRDSDDPTP